MDWLNLIPRSNIVSSITRKILTTAQCRLTYQPVFRSPISTVLHRNFPATYLGGAMVQAVGCNRIRVTYGQRAVTNS
jgi:hypothetical protein